MSAGPGAKKERRMPVPVEEHLPALPEEVRNRDGQENSQMIRPESFILYFYIAHSQKMQRRSQITAVHEHLEQGKEKRGKP